MRLLRLAVLAIATLVSADANTTHESRNILPSTFKPAQHFRNVNLVRNINLEKSYARETINVVVENVDAQPQSEYFLPFEQSSLGRIGGLEVKDKKDPEKDGFLVDVVEVDPHGYGIEGRANIMTQTDDDSRSTQYYKITFPSALPSKEQLTLSITYYTLSALSPLPAQIAQTDKQYVLHAFSAYAPSAYTTSKQKTKLKLPGVDVPDATTLPAELNADGKEDPQKQGTTYTYGPYNELPAGAVQEVSVRYEFTKPLLRATLLERDIEVSHWGSNIALEERHWLHNRAASLKNHFSRVTYQQSAYYNPPTPALKEMRFPLTIGSMDPYFVDEIGNVSTSRFRSNIREANLELKPRYPMFGGWNYSFKVGWNNDLKGFVRRTKGASDQYVLKVPFFEGPKQAEGVEYERVVTRVILPEGAKNIHFETTVPLVSNATGLHPTFMDTIGRTTLTLTAINMVDEFRDRDLVVTYEYPFAARFRKPLVIFAGLLAVFAVSWVVGNLDVNVPKTRRTYCKGKECKKHTNHKVTQYKAGKASQYAQGKRRYDRKQSGYGGQTKPVFHKKAKTTKKVVLRLECTQCKTKAQLALKRCKHFELGGDKKTKGAALVF
ncbi:dolichyl-diphosphooligosaccharide--protein glycosyltransferase subunit 1 [Friedmanniomyces endolithicus]|uniref:Dolichyl-diphosphooligosaccharide--protein glycosyltransferase subunit 1 n=1 Tax=Friedmanniomyces endolithicus TaxID=329885 RepID=A0AAN6J5U6_9PEZI|nr:dolichyl-diphosphooligosaccharide--protein glycosyltransferase subunit 1 [Friedmanniomyces endolithicus]KAK0287186.1 dolichyl-diphosphooligosaccharide--protein glycosyltransferase subunit 1 [Friedmanniomyces endolithicus]KAK0317558.1 dolichyl-diphosphooligosaccharide--protein glycosyltransferase subunit 1 [Friedmanniomyces endolithicus]KAK0994138.1 dolichyl-diphosphooligosaccharide--protein glycosyltransferase subunit 1 [Friedmanniomyces endolithicus]